MQHNSSKQIYSYWNKVRDGRIAPNRFEIEPVMISDLLPDVFILEFGNSSIYRFRLAGTRLCENLGHELRGRNLLDYWNLNDREAVQNLLHNVEKDGAGAILEFTCKYGDREDATFEMTILPLVHNGQTVTRMLGSVGALYHPYWLGSIELHKLDLTSFDLIWPDRKPAQPLALVEPHVPADQQTRPIRDGRPKLRVLEGGLSASPDQALDS